MMAIRRGLFRNLIIFTGGRNKRAVLVVFRRARAPLGRVGRARHVLRPVTFGILPESRANVRHERERPKG